MFKHKSKKIAKSAVKQDYHLNCHRIYSCAHCRAHLACHDELVSKLFRGMHGRAYLFNKVINIHCRQAVQRELLTGLHEVADIYCDNCQTTIGWYYERAFETSQKYKEGKYIIELIHMLKENEWDPTSYNVRALLLEARPAAPKQSIVNRSFQVGDKFISRIRRFSSSLDKSMMMVEPAPVETHTDSSAVNHDSNGDKQETTCKHDNVQISENIAGTMTKATPTLGRFELNRSIVQRGAQPDLLIRKSMSANS